MEIHMFILNSDMKQLVGVELGNKCSIYGCHQESSNVLSVTLLSLRQVSLFEF